MQRLKEYELSRKSPEYISRLPPELHVKILEYMSDKDFANACNTNVYYRSLYKDDHLWKLRFLKKYELTKFKQIPNLTFEKLYKILKNIKKNKELIWAASHGHIEVVELLLDRGANIHVNNDDALIWAARNGHIEVVKLLLDSGADIQAKYDKALIYASNNDNIEVVKLLLDRGVGINAVKNYALKWAANKGHIEIVKFLLDSGADIHADNEYALKWAANNDHIKVVKLLLDRGANRSVLTKEQLKKYGLL